MLGTFCISCVFYSLSSGGVPDVVAAGKTVLKDWNRYDEVPALPAERKLFSESEAEQPEFGFAFVSFLNNAISSLFVSSFVHSFCALPTVQYFLQNNVKLVWMINF